MSQEKEPLRGPAETESTPSSQDSQPGSQTPEKNSAVGEPENNNSKTDPVKEKAPASASEMPVENKTGDESGKNHDERIRLEKASDEDRDNSIAQPGDTETKDAEAAAEQEISVPDKKPVMASSIWSSIFNGCAKVGPLVLLLSLCAMIWPEFMPGSQALYCPAESKYISTFMRASALDSWLAPMGLAGTAWTEAQWPLYYWYLGALGKIPGLAASGLLLPAAGVLAGALAIIGIWTLAMAARFGAAAAFAAGIVFLCSPLLAPLPHFVGPITLSLALMLFALAFFSMGWRADNAWVSLPLAFICTALATLCGGVLFLAIPLVACILYLFWSLRWRRAQALDALCGFILFLVILGWWFGTIMWGDYPQSYLSSLIMENWKLSWPPEKLWWLVLAAGFAGVLPWLLSIFGVSWVRVLAKSGQSLAASRKDNGSALVWLSLVIAICLSLITLSTHAIAVIIACLAAILLGKAFVNLPPLGNRLFFFLASLLLLLAGLAVAGSGFHFTASHISAFIAPWLPDFKIFDWAPELLAIRVIGGIMILGGLLGFFFVRRHHLGGGMIYALLFSIILCQPICLMLVPELGARGEARLETLAAIEQRTANALKAPAENPDVLKTPEIKIEESSTPMPEENTDNASVPSSPSEPVETPSPAEAKPSEPVQNATEADAVPVETAPAKPESAPGDESVSATDEKEADAAKAGQPQKENAPDVAPESETPVEKAPPKVPDAGNAVE